MKFWHQKRAKNNDEINTWSFFSQSCVKSHGVRGGFMNFMTSDDRGVKRVHKSFKIALHTQWITPWLLIFFFLLIRRAKFWRQNLIVFYVKAQTDKWSTASPGPEIGPAGFEGSCTLRTRTSLARMTTTTPSQQAKASTRPPKCPPSKL